MIGKGTKCSTKKDQHQLKSRQARSSIGDSEALLRELPRNDAVRGQGRREM
jgi:hypothetical protein